MDTTTFASGYSSYHHIIGANPAFGVGSISVSTANTIEILLGIIGVLLIPAVGLMIRGAIKWTRTEDTVKFLMEQAREDRAATNRRLEFLESIWIELGYKKK